MFQVEYLQPWGRGVGAGNRDEGADLKSALESSPAPEKPAYLLDEEMDPER